MTSRKRASGLGLGQRGRALLFALGLAGCGGSGMKEPTPVAMLAASHGAQAALPPIVEAWAHGQARDRLATEPRLADLVRRYPTDELARTATAHLAWLALERGQVARAVALARAVERGPAGTTKDLALVVEGGALRRQGRPDEAMRALGPLVGRLVDGYARALLDEEVILAALAAKRWDAAVRFIGVWLGEASDEDAEEVRGKVARLLAAVPPETLLAMLAAPHGAATDDDAVRQLLARRLADVAVARKDPSLAKRLLTIARQLLGERGDAVAELAAGATAARVEARTVGLLLSLSSDETRRRGIDVATGLASGLGLPGSGARLVSRTARAESDGIVEALRALSADGAAVIVAGVDELEATEAARFADANEVSVLVLRPPADGAGARFGFVLGEDPRAIGEALTAALAKRGATPSAWLGEGAAAASPCGGALPLADWKRAGIAGLVVMGSPSCARDALAAVAGSGLRLAFGLDAGESARVGELVATAGSFPRARGPKPYGAAEPAPEGPSGWWAALGHDAGVLVGAAFRALPAEGTDDPVKVRSQRAAVASALAGVEGALFTTEAKGFAGGRVLARTVAVREAR